MDNVLFNENMTSEEARKILYKAAETKTKKEMEVVIEEYMRVITAITCKELSMVEKGWML